MRDDADREPSELLKVVLQPGVSLRRVSRGRFAPTSLEVYSDSLICNWLYYPDTPTGTRHRDEAGSFAALTVQAHRRSRATADVVAMLTELARVEDALGTHYRRRSGGAGSSDASRAITGDWKFTPPPPPTVSSIRLLLGGTAWILQVV